MGPKTKLHLLEFPLNGHDVNTNRLASLRVALDEDPDLLNEMLEIILDFTNQFPPGEDTNLDRLEMKIEECQFWGEKWVGTLDEETETITQVKHIKDE